MSALVYIGTTHDASGNPRRGWIIGYGSDSPQFCNEGYAGSRALEAFGIRSDEGKYLPMIVVTPGEFRSWSKLS